MLSLLARAIARNSLPPALLLAGQAGIGKRRAALAVAKTLNCLEPRPAGDLETDACGTCESCRRIARGVHPDVLIVEPGDSGSIKVEQVRDVIDRANYRPFEGRRRAVIVDDADALVDHAQNALLKTLEEPPSASVFLLVSSLPDALLATVRSRCPRLRFAPLSASDVARVLVRDHGYSDADARASAADADGSVGRALAARSTNLTEIRGTAKDVLERLARVQDPVRRLDVVKGMVGSKGPAAVERERMTVCLRALSSLLRDVSMLAEGADPRALANADLEAELGRLVDGFNSQRCMRAFMAVDRALIALDRNASPKVVADWLVLQL